MAVSDPWGYPQIIHVRLRFSIVNHPAIGSTPFQETPKWWIVDSWHGQWRYMDHVPINHTITPNSFPKWLAICFVGATMFHHKGDQEKKRASTGRTIIGMENMSLWDTKKGLPEHHRKSQWHPMTHFFSLSFIVDCYYRRSTVWLVNWVILLSGNEQFSLALLIYVYIYSNIYIYIWYLFVRIKNILDFRWGCHAIAASIRISFVAVP